MDIGGKDYDIDCRGRNDINPVHNGRKIIVYAKMPVRKSFIAPQFISDWFFYWRDVAGCSYNVELLTAFFIDSFGFFFERPPPIFILLVPVNSGF